MNTTTTKKCKHADDLMTCSDVSRHVKDVPGLTFGYIGNFERWGDDRILIIWVKSAPRDAMGNTAQLWSAEAKTLTRREVARARTAIKHFQMGWEAALKSAK